MKFAASLARAGRPLQPIVLLFVRVCWGYQLVESGWGHFTHVAKTAEFFRNLHVPLPELSVYVSATTELVGGALLILGLFARIVSVPLIFNFIVAYLTASLPDLVKTFHDKGAGDTLDAFVNDSAFPFLVLALLMLAFGAGALSLDRALSGRTQSSSSE